MSLNKAQNINFENDHIEPLTFEDEDVINKPGHYHKGGIDVIAFAEMKLPKEQLKGFYRINIMKYVTRYEEKNGIEDLKKSQFYLNKLIELEETYNG